MSGKKWKSPLENWEEENQDPNLAFTLVAQNERAKQMWADPHNSSRYVPASFTRRKPKDRSLRVITPPLPDSENKDQPRLEIKEETEPALQFLFSDWPKNFAKGFVLGSYDKPCDALLGDPGDYISQQMLAFTFNKHHQLIMNVTSDNRTTVTFNNQKEGKRTRFSWIFPRGQEMIRVRVADVLVFDVVMPKYGINKDQFHRNCESFLSAAASGDPLADDLDINSVAATGQASGTSSPPDPFYLRGKKLGSGSYGDVFKVLRMPDGKNCAAKEFKNTISMRQEVDMLKKVCQTFNKNIVQFVEEWHEDYKPLLVMEYVAGGNLQQRMRVRMEFEEIASLAGQTLSALAFLHDQGVMHRDIKPANILCVTPNHYKLADFGVSRDITSLPSKQGTAEYMAPEVHAWAPYSYEADIWSVGVVLFECMDELPRGNPRTDGRRWCKGVLHKFTRYHDQCEQSPDMSGSDAFELIRLVKDAMLRLDADERLSARRCVRHYSYLWEDLDGSDDSDAGSGANTPTKAHPNGSFSPKSPGSPEGDEDEDETSRNVHRDGEGTPERGRQPQDFRNEAKTAVRGDSAYNPASAPNHPPSGGETINDQVATGPSSISRGMLNDPARVFPSLPSLSKPGNHTRSISDGGIKRRRDSQSSAEGGEKDGSVTPGALAPDRSGSEDAVAGLDGSLSAKNHKRSKSSVSIPAHRTP